MSDRTHFTFTALGVDTSDDTPLDELMAELEAITTFAEAEFGEELAVTDLVESLCVDEVRTDFIGELEPLIAAAPHVSWYAHTDPRYEYLGQARFVAPGFDATWECDGEGSPVVWLDWVMSAISLKSLQATNDGDAYAEYRRRLENPPRTVLHRGDKVEFLAANPDGTRRGVSCQVDQFPRSSDFDAVTVLDTNLLTHSFPKRPKIHEILRVTPASTGAP